MFKCPQVGERCGYKSEERCRHATLTSDQSLSSTHIYTRTHKGQAPSAPYHVPKQSVHNSWAPHQLKRGKDSFTCPLFKTLLAIGEQPQHSCSFNIHVTKQAHLKYSNISLIRCLQLHKQSRIVYPVNLFVTQVTSKKKKKMYQNYISTFLNNSFVLHWILSAQ